MRLRYKALILVFLLLAWRADVRGSDQQYDPPPFPNDFPPWPNDPPDPFSDPFDPINDLPDPFDIPLPPEDPIDFPDPILDFPPPEIPDPFPDLPSLIPDPFDDIPDVPLPDLPDFPPDVRGTPEADVQPQAASNVVASLMPFPMRLPFHPAYSGVSAPKTVPTCNAASAPGLVIAEANNNTVAFYSTCPFARTQRVSVGAMPVAARATPDGQFVWVANVDSSNISIVSVSSKTVVGTIALPPFNGDAAEPNGVVFTPDGTTAYVTNHDANPGSVIFVIDVASRTVLTTIPTDGYPAAAAVTPDGSTVWVTNRADSTITVIDTLTNTVVTHVQADYPLGVAFNPTGTRAYVAEAELGSEATGYANGYLKVFDAWTTDTIARIPVGVMPHVVKVTPSGHYIFVTNLGSNSISEINTLTNTVIHTIPVPGQHPLGLAFIK